MLFIPKSKKLLKTKIAQQENVKIVIGAGATSYPNWISTEKDLFDITNQKDWHLYFNNKLIDNILAEHVFEHLTYHEIKQVLNFSKKYLKKGGCLRIAVPDANHPSRYVYDLTNQEGLNLAQMTIKFFLI
jgi:predicted SAM-dependent methyltransferase